MLFRTRRKNNGGESTSTNTTVKGKWQSALHPQIDFNIASTYSMQRKSELRIRNGRRNISSQKVGRLCHSPIIKTLSTASVFFQLQIVKTETS